MTLLAVLLCCALAACAHDISGESVQAPTWSTEVPYWPHYPTRTVQVLDGLWSFGYSDSANPLTIPFSEIQTPDNTTVPSCFDVAPPGIMGPRGTAFYQTTFSLEENTPGLVYFSACSFYCRVFIDGAELGDHRAGGYQPFAFPVPASPNAVRTLTVVVNNEFNPVTAPTHTGGDFWMYGGITRSVLVHTLPFNTYIQRVETFTVEYSGIININVVLGGNTDVPAVNLSLSWDDASEVFVSAPVVNGIAKLTNQTVPNAQPWSIGTPNLHTLAVSLYGGVNVDAVEVRFGLRVLGVEEGTSRLTINGEVIKLHGTNRHTMWLDTGSALTLAQIQQDVALLQEMNANYVRGAHYPQDQRFLDLCDEVGIVIWEETLGPEVSLQNLTNPYFMQYQIQAVNEMIDASINHPSVILHGFYNEGPSNDILACPGYNTSASAIRARVGNPPTRLVTWANNHVNTDVCIPIEDVIAFNSYPAWYQEPGNLSYIVPYWTSMAEWAFQHYPAKPFVISETGAGGVYEWTNTTDPMWSQLFESQAIALDAGFAVNTSSVSGITVWQFADIKANDYDTVLCGQCDYYPHPNNMSVPWDCAYININCARPGGENHKGQVDFWRRPKMSFTTLQQIYGNAEQEDARN